MLIRFIEIDNENDNNESLYELKEEVIEAKDVKNASDFIETIKEVDLIRIDDANFEIKEIVLNAKVDTIDVYVYLP